MSSTSRGWRDNGISSSSGESRGAWSEILNCLCRSRWTSYVPLIGEPSSMSSWSRLRVTSSTWPCGRAVCIKGELTLPARLRVGRSQCPGKHSPNPSFRAVHPSPDGQRCGWKPAS
jgi:hypothetical protein